MAEAWVEEEEEELRERRDPGARRNRRVQLGAATDRSDRNKPERQSSQGPLSSIRAAIKRTATTRSNAQNEHPRERRRPEITILSAEPLATNSWFSGATGSFPPAPPPSQGIWGSSIPASAQPPPSYDQVIKEKTQEQVPATSINVTPRASTTTIATQTDFEEADETAGTGSNVTLQAIQSETVLRIARKPPKPPRPSLLPSKTKSVASETTVVAAGSVVVSKERPVVPSRNPVVPCKLPHGAKNSIAEATNNPLDPPGNPAESLLVPSSAVSEQAKPNEPCFVPSEFPCALNETLVISTDPHSAADPAPREEAKQPVPRPRSKLHLKPVTKEVKVQTLVRLKEEYRGESSQEIPESGEIYSGAYLQDLLEVFSTDNQSDQSDQSDETEEDDMNTFGSQRSIRAKIQAFESQSSITGSNEEIKKPELRPRTQMSKPPITAAKPSLAPKPSNRSFWEGDTVTESKPLPAMKNSPALVFPTLQGTDSAFDFNVDPFNLTKNNYLHTVTNNPTHFGTESVSFVENHIPDPAPRPVLPKKPAEMDFKDATQTEKSVPFLPPRQSVTSVAKNFMTQNEGSALNQPTLPVQGKPSLDLFNLYNQNAASFPFGNSAGSESTETTTDFSSNIFENVPNRPAVSRKPTMIRVPSRPNNLCEVETPDPPPLPAHNPVGGFTSSVIRKPSFASRPAPQESITSEWRGSSMSEPTLPPRPSGGRSLPPRPPPIKGTSGRLPPRSLAQPRSTSVVAPKWQQSQKVQKKGPVLPPRPKPGHPLYNNYTLAIPHGIAEYDFNGRNPGELSFQKNEVLVLLEQIDNNTFECQVGDCKGRVQTSYMKIIIPLSKMPSNMERSQPVSPGGPQKENSGLQVQVLHDFTPENPDELALRAGDTVSMVERVDDEWYRGTCWGRSGIFPASYVKALSSIPAPPNGRCTVTEPISGPRCVARFDYEGEQTDELSFSEGDVIRLKQYVDQDWARGEFGGHTGIFPLSFVEIVEDLPTASAQQPVQNKIPLPGLGSTLRMNQDTAKARRAMESVAAEWAVALYDFTAQTDEDLPFKQGDHILITEHVDSDWCRGRLNGREGFFPTAFVQSSAGSAGDGSSHSRTNRRVRVKALFDFTSEAEDELSLKVGDIITDVESVDDEWILGELRGKRGLVPKNYVQVL
ncbi:SH3 domain-containing protein 19 [Amia ocellicauda]|uniref:SH3 domain-containing protein 19 n=1 Tax=Amia ocellicauda TaxID=2972642 RepID=UPI003464098D